jgi:enoyl-CoA hydratase
VSMFDTGHTLQLLKISDAGDGVALVEFDRKSKANAFSEELLRQIAMALTAAQEDAAVCCVVVTGGAKYFAAGGDLQEWESKEPIDLWASKRNEYWRVFNEFPKPLVAAVNGTAYGGGCEFALQCDIAVCGESARFCLPEIGLGFVPGRGGTQRLPLLVGRSAASYMIMTGQPVTARRALEIGLVLEVCPDERTVERAVEIAKSIAVHPTEAVQIAKELIRSSFMHLASGLKYEARSFEFLKGTPNSKVLTRRFVERRRSSNTTDG